MESVVEIALEVVADVLYAFDLYVEHADDDQSRDCELRIVQDDPQKLVINVVTEQGEAGVLIGKLGTTHEAFQRICYAALSRRLNQPIGRLFFVTINDRRPEFRTTKARNGYFHKEAAVVVVTAPPEVKVRVVAGTAGTEQSGPPRSR